MAVQRAVRTASFKAGATIAKYAPVKNDTVKGKGFVIPTTANSDKTIGFAQLDALEEQELPVALIGSVLKMRVGSAGVSQNDWVGLDSSDPSEIETLTLSATGTTIRQVIGLALESGNENDYIEVLLQSFCDKTA